MGRNKTVVAIIILFLLSMAQSRITAQERIFEKKLTGAPDHPDFGPNRRHFYHSFISSSFILPSYGTTTIRTRQPLTGQLSIGFRYKLKAGNPFAIVSECGLSRSMFKISQPPGKSFPDTVLHVSQTMRFNGLFGGLFVRFRLGQRGDYLGNYIDAGLTAQTSILNYLVTKDVVGSADQKPFLIEKTTKSALNNINLFNYKASLRVGFDRFSLMASYRLSRLLNGVSVADLPDFEIGIEISPVRY
jgi:hypothetical protein